MPRTLLVDTNRAAYPLYQELITLGHEVWVVGRDANEPLAMMVDNYYQLDYSDLELLKKFIDEKKFDYIVPGCTDLSYKVCSMVSKGKYPGIDSYSVTQTINDKEKFRKIAVSLGLPVPQVLGFEDSLEYDSVIVKPVDAFSGRGISVLEKPCKPTLQKALQFAQKVSGSNTAVIEEYVSGQLYSFSAFLVDGKVTNYFVVQEDSISNRFAVDLSRLAHDFPKETITALLGDLDQLVKKLDIKNGLLHTQFIFDGKNYWIIEMTRRCPGDIYSLLIQLSTGFPYAANYIAPFISRQYSDCKWEEKKRLIIRHTMQSKHEMPFWGVSFCGPVDIELLVPLKVCGDYADTAPEGRLAVLFLNASSRREQDELYQKLLDTQLYSLPK